MSLLDVVAAESNLRNAWRHVWESDGEDGIRAGSVERFAESPEENIGSLARSLRDRTYRPGGFGRVAIPKADGERILLLGSARDRVVERAIQAVLDPIVDTRLSHAAFAYRKGSGVGDAVRRVAELRDEGLCWAFRGDVDDCFDSIGPDLALAALRRVVDDRDLNRVVALLLGAEGPRAGLTRGIPTGGSLAPMLTNLVLHEVDIALLRQGFQVVRFADDLVVPASTEGEALKAKEVTMRELERLGLRLGAEKTEVTEFAEGFAFLGEEFNDRYPAVVEPRAEPTRRTLYVGHQGAWVSLRSGRIRVSRRDNELLSVPLAHVGRLVVAGSVSLSPGIRSWCFTNGVDVVFLTRRGDYLGTLSKPGTPTAARIRRQYEVTMEDAARLGISRVIVSGKLSNHRPLLLRFNRREVPEEVAGRISELDRLIEMAGEAESLDGLRGLEGMGARCYFGALATLLPDGLGFGGRNRRPPMDVVNAALSYGYAILLGAATVAIRIAGLDPAAGFLHADAHGRPALALDLIEEFRPVVVDAAVLEMARRGTLNQESVRTEEGKRGVLLTERARKALMSAIEDRLLTVAHYPRSGRRETRQRQMILQAHLLAAHVDGKAEYEAMRWR